MATRENGRAQLDPELKANEMILDEILDKFAEGEGNIVEAKEIALRYAEGQRDYAETHPGMTRMADGSDATVYDFIVWSQALNHTREGNWEPLAYLIQGVGESVLTIAGVSDD